MSKEIYLEEQSTNVTLPNFFSHSLTSQEQYAAATPPNLYFSYIFSHLFFLSFPFSLSSIFSLLNFLSFLHFLCLTFSHTFFPEISSLMGEQGNTFLGAIYWCDSSQFLLPFSYILSLSVNVKSYLSVLLFPWHILKQLTPRESKKYIKYILIWHPLLTPCFSIVCLINRWIF